MPCVGRSLLRPIGAPPPLVDYLGAELPSVRRIALEPANVDERPVPGLAVGHLGVCLVPQLVVRPGRNGIFRNGSHRGSGGDLEPVAAQALQGRGLVLEWDVHVKVIVPRDAAVVKHRSDQCATVHHVRDVVCVADGGEMA